MCLSMHSYGTAGHRSIPPPPSPPVGIQMMGLVDCSWLKQRTRGHSLLLHAA